MIYFATVTTPASPADVAEGLRDVTIPAQGFLWNWRHIFTWDGRRPPEFAGQVRDGSFKLQYLSPFLCMTARPIVTGDTAPSGTGTKIRLRLRAVGPDWAGGLGTLVVMGREITEGRPGVAASVALPLVLVWVTFWLVGCFKTIRAIKKAVGT